MAKAKTKPKKEEKRARVEVRSVLEPRRVHELLGTPGPYDEPKRPPDWPGSTTFWDPGCSLVTLLAKAPHLFNKNTWFTGEAFGKAQDQDGRWSGHHCITGRTFCTSGARLVVMADRTPFLADVIKAAHEVQVKEKKKPDDPVQPKSDE